MKYMLIFKRLLGITVDEDYGGLAMGYQAHCVVMEEISRASGNIDKEHRDVLTKMLR